MLRRGDIDIDFADRSRALSDMPHVPASIIRDGKITKHNTGVYFHSAPIDPVTGLCSIDYESAEQRGLFKIDMLNVGVYELVRDEDHLLEMMQRQLDWDIFTDRQFVSKLFHLGNHADLCARCKPRSISDIAMLLALIRPGKRHLQHRCETKGFDSISAEIWQRDQGDAYEFKKSHAHSYSMLVYVHANLLLDISANHAIIQHQTGE